jgi:hypothetical protein
MGRGRAGTKAGIRTGIKTGIKETGIKIGIKESSIRETTAINRNTAVRNTTRNITGRTRMRERSMSNGTMNMKDTVTKNIMAGRGVSRF